MVLPTPVTHDACTPLSSTEEWTSTKPTCGERRESIVLNFGTVIVALTTCGTGMLGGSITEGLTAFQDDVSEIEDLESPG